MQMRRIAVVVLGLAAGCADHDDGAAAGEGCADAESLVLRPDLPLGDEAYLCFGYEAPRRVGGLTLVRSIAVREASASAVTLHHAAVFATTGAFPEGPVECLDMPQDAEELYVWVPGAGALELPGDAAMALPEGALRLIVQVHVMRVREGLAKDVGVDLCLADGPVAHVAGWMHAQAPVPAIRPHHAEASTADCTLAAPLHLVSVWPHMHRLGTAFHGAILGAGGVSRPTIDVVPWSADEQRMYALDVDSGAGDRIRTSCEWQNPGDEYVFPGPGIDDEMCSQSFIAWPKEAARCDR